MASCAAFCSTISPEDFPAKQRVSPTFPRRLEQPNANNIDINLTQADQLVVKHLLDDVTKHNTSSKRIEQSVGGKDAEKRLLKDLEDMNNENSPQFEPTVFCSWDLKDISAEPKSLRAIFDKYVEWASRVSRHRADVVFVTHLILYFTTLLPSALYLLLYKFSWAHGIVHAVMAAYYIGSYTLMRHNHIHNNGILSQKWWIFDTLFPYLLDPLMGHTWNSYYYHHVKHHHVEGNGPGDVSSTLRLQRDEISSLMYYVGRFMFLIWIELPLYFIRTGKYRHAFNSAFWEFSSYSFMFLSTMFNAKASVFLFLLPFSLIRLGLMLGNFGQHAFVDEMEPDSDYRSSITLIDVPSNRFCFNDGYHTAHHLNPRRHWRDQPVSFVKGQDAYVEGRALVFQKIDYLEITYRLMRKDYDHLARCFVPIGGEQSRMSHQDVVGMLKRKTRRFTEDEIKKRFNRY